MHTILLSLGGEMRVSRRDAEAQRSENHESSFPPRAPASPREI
jgi:hypothetical protein